MNMKNNAQNKKIGLIKFKQKRNTGEIKLVKWKSVNCN